MSILLSIMILVIHTFNKGCDIMKKEQKQKLRKKNAGANQFVGAIKTKNTGYLARYRYNQQLYNSM